MREVTAKELAKAFEGQIVDVSSSDDDVVSFGMSRARIDYNEEYDELLFTAGNHNHDGLGSVKINVEEFIDSIEYDEDFQEFYITFSHTLSNITVSRFRSLEE